MNTQPQHGGVNVDRGHPLWAAGWQSSKEHADWSKALGAIAALPCVTAIFDHNSPSGALIDAMKAVRLNVGLWSRLRSASRSTRENRNRVVRGDFVMAAQFGWAGGRRCEVVAAP